MADKHLSLLLMARIQRIPTTRYTWGIVLLAAGCLVVEALDIGSLSIILPVVKGVMGLTPSRVGILAASSALGIAIGMIPAGFLADRLGRKRLLLFGTIWFGALTMLSALSPNFVVLALMRGLSGLGMAPAFIMPYALVSELVPARARAIFAGVLEISLGVGYLIPPLLGLAIIPNFAPDTAWRVFLFIAGLPVLYVVAVIRYLPESPRWLSRNGDDAAAERIVADLEARVERVTGTKLPPPVVGPEAELALMAAPRLHGFAAIAQVWRPPYRTRTLAMISGAFGTFSLFYVGVNYIPSLFAEQHIGLQSAFLFTLVTSAVQLPGKLLNGLLSDFVGRKKIYLAYTSLALVGALAFGRATTPYAMLGWASLFLFAASGSAPSYKMWYAEQYPTRIRAIGQSTVEGLGGRLLGGVVWTFFFPILLAAFGIGTTMIVVVTLSAVALAIVTIWAPETSRRTVEELEAEVAIKTTGTGIADPLRLGRIPDRVA